MVDMTTFMIVLYMVNPWLHDYSAPKNWTNKYDALYKKAVSDNGLDAYDVDYHLLKAIAVIESGQSAKKRGGGGRKFWGLFQMSKELAKMFGGHAHRKMLDPKVNAATFGKWVNYYITKLYQPMVARRAKKGYPKLTDKQWQSIIYAGHNIGPNIAKYAILYWHPMRWLVKKMIRVRGRKDGLYRTALFMLTPKLRIVSVRAVLSKKNRVKWWNRRDAMLKVLGYGDGRLNWAERTKNLSKLQAASRLPVTGIWDNVTEALVIKKVIACRKKEKALPLSLRRFSVLASQQ